MDSINEQSHCRLIELACIMESAAEKPGNVTSSRPFEDLAFSDFRDAAKLSAPHLANRDLGVGTAIERAIDATIKQSGTNVNLGICLLIAPLAAIDDGSWPDVEAVSRSLSVDDAEAVYRAINLAQPSGLGDVSAQDVKQRPTVTLLEAMKLAASHDEIARLYATDFQDLFEFAVPVFVEELHDVDLPDAIVRLAVRWQAKFPDTHITRRCGHHVAKAASSFADEVSRDWNRLPEFDDWLRADGHKRNPGTTADVVAATLYVSFRSNPNLADVAESWLLQRGYR